MSETGIEIVPLFGMFLRQKTFLEKIDEIINRDMIGCEGCDECLEDLCYSCFGCKPELWEEYDGTARKIGYGHLLSKLFLTYYLSDPRIPDEAKQMLRSSPVEHVKSFLDLDIFGISKCLDKLLCAYAEKKGWRITDIVIPLSAIENVEDDAEAHQKLREYFPSWLRQAVEGNPGYFTCIDAVSLIYESTEPMHLIIWESKDLYRFWEYISKYPRACTYAELEVYNTFSMLECVVFRQNPMFQNGYMGNAVSHDRQTVALYSITGYEMVGDDSAYQSSMINQAYVYNWSCIEVLEWLQKGIQNVCKNN